MPETLFSPEYAQRRDTLALSLADGIGPIKFQHLLATFGSAPRAFDAARIGGAERSRARDAATRAMARADQIGAVLLLRGDDRYPSKLLELHDPPPAIWALGNLQLIASERVAVSVVGTRSATSYGERMTQRVATALASSGVVIVSGLARGIDAAAHRAALAVGGATIAVLGTGIDVAYPAAHRGLHAEIARNGLLVSEELPETRATPGSFPKRNRVIASLSVATLVVEAPHRSGALITAGHALDLNRMVAAVPGPMDAPSFAGSNELLRDGAHVIASVADALALVGVDGAQPAPAIVHLAPHERRVWDALRDGSLDSDALGLRAGLAPRDCLGALSALEIAGLVTVDAVGFVHRQ
ncbi:MAG: DNA-processing protein DprA [Gemmatimonadota bacterium]|nr:DNA-processing protein DprA [Gemmatimonadota bacterium]